nr:steroid 17-alpha-hydroxylase/17,20 lyase-like [Hydra vulgaris]
MIGIRIVNVGWFLVKQKIIFKVLNFVYGVVTNQNNKVYVIMFRKNSDLLKGPSIKYVRSYEGGGFPKTYELVQESVTETDSHEKITDDNTEFLLNDFMIAGSETSSNMILWFIVYILHRPEYQDKLYDEIFKVFSGIGYPSLNDRPRFHLIQAITHETLRLLSVAPLGLCHKAMENGYAYLPFSGGPRSCLGETLAKTELFVFISRLVKDYRFEKPNGKELPSLDGRSGVTCLPYEFEIVMIPRS